MKNIYLDNSATTPIDKKVFEKMMPYCVECFGNPSSIHGIGQKCAEAVEDARLKVASFLNCLEEEILFTSGATEADNLAIFGLVRALGKKKLGKMHVITSQIEHPAVLECFRILEDGKEAEVSYAPVDEKGMVKLGELEKILKENTVLVSIMYVNNEVGSVQPIREIGTLIETIKKKREKKKSDFPIYFHTDAVQAANFYSCDVESLRVDMLSLSGHKIYGPKGVGALFVRKGMPLLPIQIGGHQERGLRSGTLNVSGIVGFGEASFLAGKRRNKLGKKVSCLRNLLVGEIQKRIPRSILRGDLKNICPSFANISFLGAEGEAILLDLDYKNISVSTGSACASGSLKTSPVLLAMGIPEEEAHGTIRFTLGKYNNKKEILRVARVLPKIIKRFRNMAPDYK